MPASYEAIIANRPHIYETLECIQHSKVPLLKMDIKRTHPQIPDHDLIRALYYAANNNLCETCKVIRPARSRPYRAYGPLTVYGHRLLASASA